MRNLVLIACAVGALVAAQHASEAAIVTRHDRAGRVVTFDVQAPGVQVGWYAAVLGNAILHGDEIKTARIRIVSPLHAGSRSSVDASMPGVATKATRRGAF